MPKKRDVGALVDQIQDGITNCILCQPYDEGEYVWVRGYPRNIEGVLSDHEVPENQRDEVVSQLGCPGCGGPIERYTKVGTKFPHEIEHESKRDRAKSRFTRKLREFADYLREYPALGASHPVGRAILKSIEAFPRSEIRESIWYMARRGTDSPPDFGPRDSHDRINNRFNFGLWCPYLASAPECAVAEVVNRGERRAWVHDFKIEHLDQVLALHPWSPDDEDLGPNALPEDIPLIAYALVFVSDDENSAIGGGQIIQTYTGSGCTHTGPCTWEYDVSMSRCPLTGCQFDPSRC